MYLKPIPIVENLTGSPVRRTVRKDNTIVYGSNRYSVPIGTYTGQKEVELEVSDGILKIYTVFHELICEHQISVERGMLIKNKNHDRDTSSPIDKIQAGLDDQLDHKAADFLVGIRTDKPRYARDQFRLLQSLLDKYGKEKLINAAKFCTENRLFSANIARDFLEFSEFPKPEIRQFSQQAIPVDKPEYHVTVQKRSLDVYAKVGDM